MATLRHLLAHQPYIFAPLCLHLAYRLTGSWSGAREKRMRRPEGCVWRRVLQDKASGRRLCGDVTSYE